MGKKLYVGNLPYSVNDNELKTMFEQFGTVQTAQVIMDRDSGQSKGFGFVELGSESEAKTAIGEMNGKEFGGRQLTVNEAKPKEGASARGGAGGRSSSSGSPGRGGYGGRRY